MIRCKMEALMWGNLLVLPEAPPLFQQTIHQSGFGMIYLGDEGNVAKVPLRNSSNVCWISSLVFITNGP